MLKPISYKSNLQPDVFAVHRDPSLKPWPPPLKHVASRLFNSSEHNAHGRTLQVQYIKTFCVRMRRQRPWQLFPVRTGLYSFSFLQLLFKTVNANEVVHDIVKQQSVRELPPSLLNSHLCWCDFLPHALSPGKDWRWPNETRTFMQINFQCLFLSLAFRNYFTHEFNPLPVAEKNIKEKKHNRTENKWYFLHVHSETK